MSTNEIYREAFAMMMFPERFYMKEEWFLLGPDENPFRADKPLSWYDYAQQGDYQTAHKLLYKEQS